HYRLATADANLPLPEGTLGMMPGDGGTQRMPRRMGQDSTHELMLTGRPMTGTAAHNAGLVDGVIDGDLIDSAVQWILNKLPEGMPSPVSARTPKRPKGEDIADVVQRVRTKLSKVRFSHAANECISCVEAAFRLPFEDGLDFERARFLELVSSTESKSLRHIFFAERRAARIPSLPKNRETRSVERVAVVGAGFMGRGIAMSFANAGLRVVLLYPSDDLVTS